MSKIIKFNKYHDFLEDIKQRVRKSQYKALKAVNKELILLYWDIGGKIIDKQMAFGWGKSVVENLAKDLQKEFPGIKGFSARNIWYMRNFYRSYAHNEKLQPLVAEIGWTHNIIIMDRCKKESECEFYITMTKKFGWTKNVLIHHIENKSFKKTLANQTNFNKTIPAEIRKQTKLAVKDEYTFDFLELGEEHYEREMERALINNVRKFLLGMGGYFCFIGNQYRIEIEGEEFFIDLLLYHRQLKCLVAIELKIGNFKPEYAGKMQFYLSAINDKLKMKDENPSIGIIICKEKNRIIVEYALKDVNKPIGVSTYKIKTSLPKKFLKYLPSSKKLAKEVGVLKDEIHNKR
ncbi:MAG: PDDEXK nuclease domain-containing protein [Elusimicrobia bacterium]|nr:PDDEXK nuclease domain-containing protein [Elusimicrobiota bacterium]